mgnify:CR=1 FL=1
MRKVLFLSLPLALILGAIGFNQWGLSASKTHQEKPAMDLSRLSDMEIAKQSKAAIGELMHSDQPDVISRQAEILRQLAKAPAAPSASRMDNLELIARLEKARLTLLSQQHAIGQDRDALLTAIQQGNLAIEMIVAPQVGADAYLAGLYQQYKDYSQTMGLVLTALFADGNPDSQQSAATRLQGMAPTALDNFRVLGLEIPALRDNKQANAGVEALQQMIKPEQGCVARWIWLQSESVKLQTLAEVLQGKMAPH